MSKSQDLTLAQCGERWGLTSRNSVKTRARILGVPLRRESSTRTVWPAESVALGDQLHQHLGQRRTLADFRHSASEPILFDQWAEAEGCSRSSAYKWARELGIRPTLEADPADPRRRRAWLSSEQAQQLSAYASDRKGRRLDDFLSCETDFDSDGDGTQQAEPSSTDFGQRAAEAASTYEHLFRSTQAMVAKSLDQALTMDLDALDTGKCIDVHAWLFSITHMLSQATESFSIGHEANPEAMGLCRAAEITSLWHKVFQERLQAVSRLVTQQIAYGLLDEDVTFGPPPSSRRKPIPKSTRFEVLHRADYTCQACGAKAADGAELHIDHIHPVSKGGTNDPTNLQALCRDCNIGKGARVL